MKKAQRTRLVVGSLLGGFACLLLWVSGCGRAIPLDTGGILGDAVVGDGGTRTDGSDLGAIYPVTTVVQVTAGPTITGFTPPGDLPFPDPAIGFNDFTLNRQVPFSFNFSFPPNNYQLYAAHLVIDTNRDASDTEGIFVDGVLTGRPPSVNASCPKTTNHHYLGNSFANPVNNYYMQFSLEHYLQNVRNTFDLDISELLKPTTKTIYNVLSDGFLPVVTADDSPVYQAFLVLDGYTISKTALTCSTLGPYTYENVYVHNDGNSISTPAFTGTVESPITSVSSGVSGFKSIEFYFDPKLPRVPIGDITLASGSVSLQVTRNGLGAGIVVNGVGVSDATFDRTQASAVVESWDDSTTAVNYWNSLLATIPIDLTPTTITLNLRSMFGETKLKTLLAQGKLNIALAGGFRRVTASAATSTRTYGTAVTGPNLTLNGTYVNKPCTIPSDASSPLTGGGVTPTLPGDTTSPQIISAQATEITNTTASVVWLTDEGADTQLAYGVANTDTLTTLDSTQTTFHKVSLTGLLPYKYYYYKIRTKDGNGNLTESGVKVFRTLR